MNTALLIAQAMLIVMMLVIGFMKTLMPVAQLKKFAWTTRTSTGFVRFVGVSEVLIGLGLLLPQITGILPILTPIAAASLWLVMLLAIAEHVRHHETNEIWKNVVIVLLATFVILGRSILLQ